jgi:hypothetical protein
MRAAFEKTVCMSNDDDIDDDDDDDDDKNLSSCSHFLVRSFNCSTLHFICCVCVCMELFKKITTTRKNKTRFILERKKTGNCFI